MRRRSVREEPPRRGPVDFDTDQPLPEGPSEGVRRWYRFTVFAVVGVALLLGFLDVLFHGQSDGARPAPVVASRTYAAPSSVPTRSTAVRRCPGIDCPNSDVPEAGIIAAFAADVPGAIVSSEHTVLGPGGATGRPLVERVLRMAFGNVDMTVTITPIGTPQPVPPAHARVRRLQHGRYDFVVSTIGLYPPTHRQLLALVADPRVISTRS